MFDILSQAVTVVLRVHICDGWFYHYFQLILPLKEPIIDSAGTFGMLSRNNTATTFSLPSLSNTFESDWQFPYQPFKWCGVSWEAG